MFFAEHQDGASDSRVAKVAGFQRWLRGRLYVVSGGFARFTSRKYYHPGISCKGASQVETLTQTERSRRSKSATCESMEKQPEMPARARTAHIPTSFFEGNGPAPKPFHSGQSAYRVRVALR